MTVNELIARLADLVSAGYGDLPAVTIEGAVAEVHVIDDADYREVVYVG